MKARTDPRRVTAAHQWPEAQKQVSEPHFDLPVMEQEPILLTEFEGTKMAHMPKTSVKLIASPK